MTIYLHVAPSTCRHSNVGKFTGGKNYILLSESQGLACLGIASLVYSNLQRLQYKYNTSEKYSRDAMSLCL